MGCFMNNSYHVVLMASFYGFILPQLHRLITEGFIPQSFIVIINFFMNNFQLTLLVKNVELQNKYLKANGHQKALKFKNKWTKRSKRKVVFAIRLQLILHVSLV